MENTMAKQYLADKLVLTSEDAVQMVSRLLNSMRRRERKFPNWGTSLFETEPHDAWYRARVRELRHKFEGRWTREACEFLEDVYHKYGELPL